MARCRGTAALAAALLLCLVAAPRPAAGLKVTVHPSGVECFTHYVEQEHFDVSVAAQLRDRGTHGVG
jgi:hypothetical protein